MKLERSVLESADSTYGGWSVGEIVWLKLLRQFSSPYGV